MTLVRVITLADTLRRSEAKFEGVERGVKGDLTALLLRPPGEGEAPPPRLAKLRQQGSLPPPPRKKSPSGRPNPAQNLLGYAWGEGGDGSNMAKIIMCIKNTLINKIKN